MRRLRDDAVLYMHRHARAAAEWMREVSIARKDGGT